MDQTTLSRWKRQAEIQGEPATSVPLADELSWLRRENEQLRLERDILKKAAACFAKESR